MNLDDEGISAYGNGRPRNRPDQALLTGAVRGIGHYRQVREFFGQCDGGQVECVAHASLKRLDSAFAEGNLAISAGKQVFRRQQPLLHRGARATLEQNRLLGGREPSQQGKILHVARAYLEHIGVLANQVHIFGAHDLSDHRQASEFASFAQDLQRLNSETLKLVGRSAGLIGAAAQHGGASALDSLGRLQQLLARLDRAGTGDDHDLGAPDLYAGYVDDRRLRPGLPADKFEGLGDGDHVVHPGRHRKSFDLMAASTAAHGGDDGALGAAGDVGLEPSLANALDDVFDLGLGGVVGHVHNHGDDLSLYRPKKMPRFYRGVGGMLE